MHVSWFTSLLLVLAGGTFPVQCRGDENPGISIPRTINHGRAGTDGLLDGPGTGEVKEDADLLPLVLELRQSLVESKAIIEKLEARVKRLEEITMDIAPDSPPRIFFGVADEGIKAYSWATNDAIAVKHTGVFNDGVAYDPIQHKLYWSSNDTLYTGSRDDADKEVVFNSFGYGVIRGLAFDWITTNLYGVTQNGIVFACNTTSSQQLDCVTLLSGLGYLYNIALNPTEGMMYWTDVQYQTISWGEMDGFGSTVLLSGLKSPIGITIDYDASRIYWTETNQIRSCNFQGTDIRTTVSLSEPLRQVASMQDRVYWVVSGSHKLQSATKAGEDIRTLYDDIKQVNQLVVATSNLPRSRTNHCESFSCSHLCVLTKSYARCVN